MNVFDMNREEFLDELAVKTTANEVFNNAPEIYDFLGTLFKQECMDSVLREWAFQWWAEVTGNDYNEIYNRWLEKK
jgi:hypothetical protein